MAIVQTQRLFWWKNKRFVHQVIDDIQRFPFFFSWSIIRFWKLCFVVQVARNFCPACTGQWKDFKHPLEVHQIPCNLEFLYTWLAFFEVKHLTMYARDLLATKVLTQSKVKRIFYENILNLLSRLQFLSLLFAWYDAIHFF